jgi:hypothetical protein
MRYLARWSNGRWKTFDRFKFTDVAMHHTKQLAEDAVATLNAVRQR